MDTIHGTGTGDKSDVGLVAAARAGDTKAFDELVKRHDRRIFAVANRITKSREDAEDIVQETFLKAFLRLDTFQGKSQFSTWLTRIAMNEGLMLLRRKRRVLEVFPARSDEHVQAPPEVFVDLKPSSEESYLRKERKELLTGAVNRLSPKCRKTILLQSIEGRSVEDVAKILGISTSATKSRLFHGYERLRRIINPELLWGMGATDSAGAQQV
jgi:RNA polymerase sigma-70 factor (ECF subfamily)